MKKLGNILTQDQVNTWMQEIGLERYLTNTQKATDRGQLSMTKPGQIALDKAIKHFAECISDWIKVTKHRAGVRQRTVVKYLEQLDPEIIAFLTSQIIVDNLSISNALQGSALAIATALEDEVRFRKVKKEIPKEWNKINKRWSYSNESHKKKVVKAVLNRLGKTWNRWPLVEKYELGLFLLEMFAGCTGFIEIGYKMVGPRRKRSVIRATNEILKWFSDANDNYKEKAPFYLPTVEPPENWTGPEEGGYKANVIRQQPLIHQFNKNVVKQGPKDIPEVYEAVNSLQRVSWSINDFVFGVFDYFWKEGISIADIPGSNLKELPPRPHDIDTNEDSKREWKRKASAIYGQNARIGSKKVLYGKIHYIARNFQYQPFYFPYKLDFRGRAYPIPSFLNPQGCSLAKGLLKFTAGKSIKSDEARGWFYVHGANTWGLDKKPFEERIQWVKDNHAAILEVYEDPISNRWWEQADSPWQFLAWCEEYGKFTEDPNFLSYLPIAMDGTNNGLQIYSLLLRDIVGATATNVAPTDSPRDIYQEVADIVTDKLKNEADSTKYEMAQNWLRFVGGKLPRAATKRPVMVLPYGGTPYSIREYIEEWYEDEILKRNLEFNRPFPTTFNHTLYLTNVLLSAVSSVLVGAVKGMDWLREVADIVTDQKAPLIWLAPTGFKVYQASVNYSRTEVRTVLGKVHRKRSIIIPENSLSKRGQSNGFSPNFVHSLDAAVMMKTTNQAVKENIVHLSMVHDSFATHAEDCPRLAEILREEVYNIFGGRNLLQELKEQIQSYLPNIKLPDPPEMGELDPKCVLESKYFFA